MLKIASILPMRGKVMAEVIGPKNAAFGEDENVALLVPEKTTDSLGAFMTRVIKSGVDGIDKDDWVIISTPKRVRKIEEKEIVFIEGHEIVSKVVFSDV